MSGARIDNTGGVRLFWCRQLGKITSVSRPRNLAGPASPGPTRRATEGAENGGRKRRVAQQTTVILVDDLDGGEASEQVEFAVDGRSYEIDLSAANSAKLREALAPFISVARRAGSRRSTGSAAPARPAADRVQNQAIREWAAAQGMKISERGRIPSNVLEAYRSSH